MNIFERMAYLEYLKGRGALILLPGIIFWIIVWAWMFKTSTKSDEDESNDISDSETDDDVEGGKS